MEYSIQAPVLHNFNLKDHNLIEGNCQTWQNATTSQSAVIGMVYLNELYIGLPGITLKNNQY